MSIVSLKKITIYGCLNEKQQVLDALQNFGILHLTSLTKKGNLLNKKNSESTSQTLEAFRYLNDAPKKLKQIKNSSSFDPYQLELQILQNKHRMEALQEEADRTKSKIEALTPWGNFTPLQPGEIGNQTFWFYIVPHHETKHIDMQTLCAAKVQKDNRFNYFVVISEKEPENMPGKQVKLPNESLNHLKDRFKQIEFELANVQLERIHLTRWLELFRENLFKLEDQAVLADASQKTFDTHSLFVLQGWIPTNEIDKVLDYTKKNELAVKVEEASEEEMPPTLLENSPSLKGGEDLLSFYMTPSYWLWDPSTTIFFSFAIFFAMIFSDAGYSIILGAIVAFFWKRLGKTTTGKRFRNVLLTLTLFSLIWGVLVGSYFGVSPSSESYLGHLKILDMNNYTLMMMLAILVGVAHIVIANLAQAWAKKRSLTALANVGWAAALIGAVFAFIGFKYSSKELFGTIGLLLLSLGFLSIIAFTSVEKPMWKRLLTGFMGLTRVTGMFGDVLSYLRLFALGLASASLAAVFNDLAKQIYLSMPGFKLLFALLIILIGHGINFALSLMSGFIHGLRLNFIEFFNWSLPEEGTPFKAFAKKETSKWNH